MGSPSPTRSGLALREPFIESHKAIFPRGTKLASCSNNGLTATAAWVKIAMTIRQIKAVRRIFVCFTSSIIYVAGSIFVFSQ